MSVPMGTRVTEGTDLSLTVANTAEVVFAVNKSRHLFIFANTSDTLMYVRFHDSSDASAGVGVPVAAGATLLLNGQACPTNRVTAVCAVNDKTYYAVQS